MLDTEKPVESAIPLEVVESGGSVVVVVEEVVVEEAAIKRTAIFVMGQPGEKLEVLL